MLRASERLTAKLALCVGALCVMVPSAVLAFGDSFVNDGAFGAFTPASIDPRVARIVAERRGADTQMMRFTPAGANSWRESRLVTVAVRIDSQVAKSITGRIVAEGQDVAAAGSARLRLAPTRYNLGLARGYSSFAAPPALSSSLSSAQIPDLAEFAPTPGPREEQGRFAARVELERGAPSARADGDAASMRDQMLDVGGSYRLTRNLDVTAGVRYEQDRDLRPLPDLDQQDSQAVYIGTQFRF